MDLASNGSCTRCGWFQGPIQSFPIWKLDSQYIPRIPSLPYIANDLHQPYPLALIIPRRSCFDFELLHSPFPYYCSHEFDLS
jgi:hypothetical protein